MSLPRSGDFSRQASGMLSLATKVAATCACLWLTACGPDLPVGVELAMEEIPDRVDFNQHVRPILSDRCWSCHGPDAGSRQAGLRLDREKDVFATLAMSGRTPVVAGNLGSSELVRRILSEDPEVMMPTPESHLTLSDRERALLVRWIDQGAEWKGHWAFLPVEDPEVPTNPDAFPEPLTEVDNFINDRLSQEGIAPASRAQDEILIRRLYLDLTGLPPTPPQIDDWLGNPSDEHYRETVEELLQTDAHAERMTMEWLDVARYADSHGLHADGERTSAPFRDWVIEAFRSNMPYDTFLIYQLAGDLIDKPTYESRMGTAFLRMHPQTSEGGAIAEEYRLSYVFDRVNTIATGLLGLTMDCARCHDHKFDPLSQEEYYSFSAFFNTVDELGMTANDGDLAPAIQIADEDTRAQLATYIEDIKRTDRRREDVAISAAQLADFSKRLEGERPSLQLDFERVGGDRLDGTDVKVPESFDLVNDDERGTVGQFDETFDFLRAGDHGRVRNHEPLSVSAWIKTFRRESGQEQTIISNSGTKEDSWRGMDFYLDDENRLNISLAHVQPSELIKLRTVDSLRTNTWYQVGFTYDGSGRASGTHLYVNGELAEYEIRYDNLTGSFYGSTCKHWENCDLRPLRIGRSHRTFTGDDAIFEGRMDDLRIYRSDIAPRDSAYWARTQVLRELQKERAPAIDTLPRMMVMEEMTHPRRTFILNRGAYDSPGKEVRAKTPEAVLPFPDDLPENRLGLTKWLLSPDNPLTGRVIVNRYWQLFFGQGLVTTPHDFGSQGALPTHPALLDYLTSRFREDWDLRELVRLIVLSDTYRRSSVPTEEQREKDPENLLLARGARYRLPAEMIRDNALAASGLLNREVGGGSVKPYQPEGLWFEKLNFSQALMRYKQDHGDSLYRRSMYTFIRRTVPPPFMTTFDASGRDVCIVKRQQTNTPLQALNLLNDPQFVEAARVLAQRVQEDSGEEVDEQLRYAHRLVTGRKAREAELEVMRSLYEREHRRFQDSTAAARALLAVGEYPVADELDAAHTAALASVGNVLFSLDAAYVRY